MSNLKNLFHQHIGKNTISKTEKINESNSEAMMGRFLDGDRELKQDNIITPGVDDQNVMQDNMDPMMGPMDSEFAPIASPVKMIDPNISATQKQLNLLDLFLTLKQQVEKLEQSYSEYDFGLIDDKDHNGVMKRKDDIVNLKDKLIKYITDNFQYETYEKSLYAYHLLRSDLVLILKWFNTLVKKYPIEEDNKTGK